MKLIACVDKTTWGIGKGNDLLFHIKEDLANFKKLTLGNTVIMGKNTYVSLPLKKLVDSIGETALLVHALQNRVNIVLTHDHVLPDLGNTLSSSIKICNDIDNLHQYFGEDTFVIGGENVYNQLLPYCDTAYITEVESKVDTPKPDKFLRNLSRCSEWDLDERSLMVENDKLTAFYSIYKRR